MINNAKEWLIDRFALRPVYDRLLNRRVPRTPWYLGDGATLAALFGVQVLTGMLLALSYSPAADSAYDSVTHITEQLLLGWFIRGIHYWAAGMMMLMLAYHFFRQILMAGYKSPREGTWMIGVCLLFGILLMSYTGYLLRWDERAVHGIRVMLHMLVRVPLVGEGLVLLVQGGPDMGPLTLTRVYALHVLIVPAILGLLMGLHLYLVIQRGTITRAERRQPVHSAEAQQQLYKDEAESEEGGEPFFPNTMFKTGIMANSVLVLVLLLAIVQGPPGLMPEGNFVEDSMPAEEWWYWWYSGLIALLPAWIAPWFVVLFPVLTLIGLLLLPLLDRGPARGIRKRPVWLLIVVVSVVALLWLSDYRRRSEFTGWPDPEPPPVPAGVTLTPDAERGRLLFAEYGCNSCHPVSGRGPRIGTDFSKITVPLSRKDIRDYTLQPPEGIAMPAYAGRLNEEELAAVVEFCHVAQTFPRRL